MTFSQDTLDRVKVVLVKTLGIQDRADTLGPSTELFGSMPELDSMAVVALALALEREFELEIDDEDFMRHAVEELLRRHGIASTARTITHDMNYNGAPFRAGEMVLVLNMLHGLDERMFAVVRRVLFEDKARWPEIDNELAAIPKVEVRIARLRQILLSYPDDPEGEQEELTLAADAEALYQLLEREVVPTFYDRDAQGIPLRWLAIVRQAIMTVTPRFSARRMVKQYAEMMYTPALRA